MSLMSLGIWKYTKNQIIKKYFAYNTSLIMAKAVVPIVQTPKDHQETKSKAKAKNLLIASSNLDPLSVRHGTGIEETPGSSGAGCLEGYRLHRNRLRTGAPLAGATSP